MAKLISVNLKAAPQVFLRLAVAPEVMVGTTEGITDGGFDERLVGELALQSLRRRVQKRNDRVALCSTGPGVC